MRTPLLLARYCGYMIHLIFTIAALSVLGVNGDCTLGRTDLVETSLGFLNPGLYIDIDNPAACSGQITAWNLCYYDPRLNSFAGNIQISLEIWRFDTPKQNGDRVGVHDKTIAIPATTESFQCITVELIPDEYIDVSAGDFIGVVTNTLNAVLPVVGNLNGAKLLFLQSAVTTVDRQSLTVTQLNAHVLHVTAEIAQVTTTPVTTQQPVVLTTTQQAIDTPTTTEPQTTTMDILTPRTEPQPQTTTRSSVGTSADPSSGLSTGDVSAIVFSLLVIMVVVVVITIFVFIFKQHRKKASYSGTSIDNAVYDVATEMTAPGKLSFEGAYETPIGGYSEPVLKKQGTLSESVGIELIYQEVNTAEFEGVYSVPQAQDYEECLLEAKQGSMSRIEEDPYQTPANSEAAIYTELKKLKIHTIAGYRIEIGSKIGSGQFGTVSEGVWNVSTSQSVPMAAKTLDGTSDSDRIKFYKEVVIMGQFKHPNVVGLYGVAKKDGKRMMIVELLPKGDLHNHLRAMRPIPGALVQPFTPQLLLEFCQQIALGMGYLAGRGFVHRDLAARNILLSENNICKIADFGMSRDLQDTDYYVSSGGKIPMKWTAPEAIHYKKYSTASDIWSYGCVLYEIWSLGTKPFEGIGNVEVLRTLGAGLRLSPPPGCPMRVYEIMIQTWANVPDHRPEFRDILLALLENKSVVLMIPPEDKATHPQAGVLGAPLEAGQRMYTALQNTYNSESS